MRICSTKSVLGAVLHMQGLLREAADTFAEARSRHDRECPADGQYRHCKPDGPLVLHSEPGVRACMLDLDMAEGEHDFREILERAERMVDWSNDPTSKASNIIKGLHYLVHASALIGWHGFLALPRAQEPLDQAVRELDKAHEWMEKASNYVFLCDILLARAIAFRCLRRIGDARKDLEALFKRSRRYQMTLSEADAWILKGHLDLDDDGSRNKAAAREAWDQADRLITNKHYSASEPASCLLKARLSYFERGRADEELAAAKAAWKREPRGRLLRELRRYEKGDWGL